MGHLAAWLDEWDVVLQTGTVAERCSVGRGRPGGAAGPATGN